MNIDINKYISPELPSVRPYNHATDSDLIEDYMTGVRRLGFIMGNNQRASEFTTVDYDITVVRSAIFPDRPEITVFHLEVEMPLGRMLVASMLLCGVDAQNVLWFSEHGRYVSAPSHLAMKREMKEALTSAFGEDFVQEIMKRMKEGHSPERPDEGDWWKSGGDPP